MKKIKYKFLIFILFLAPLVQAVDSVVNNSKEPTIIVKPSCHETKQTIQDSMMSMGCECEDCTCGCFYNNLIVLNSNKSEPYLSNYTSIVVFNNVIPYRESHPPFRPPII